MGRLHGNTRGLRARQKKQAEKIADVRLKSDRIVTSQLVQRLVDVSADIGRAVGVFVDRRGRVTEVAIGEKQRIYLPDPGRSRGGGDRFRGIRLVRTTFGSAKLDTDDLTDLTKLQLDAVAVVGVGDDGTANGIEWAHSIPDNPDGELWHRYYVDNAGLLPEDFGDFILELEAEFEAGTDATTQVADDVAMLVYINLPSDNESTARIEEMRELCRTADVHIVDQYVQNRTTPDPKYGVGKGALEEIELRCLQLGADILIMGQDLSPAQIRNITRSTGLRVVDRTQLILDIFAQRAQSSVGKVQVELAQLKYALPRLSGKGEAMSRLAGGIGGRGPGETRLEIDRRRARDRIAQLEKRIDKLGKQRDLRRKSRRERGVPIISIVGYTNAGKSTLLNRLTDSSVLSEDKLFATLDPTTRRIRFPGEREVVLTDTVGFIRDLPEELREAFRATLEELEEADIMLHVIDATDDSFRSHIASTEAILADLGVDDRPRLLVFNKADVLGPEDDERRDEIHLYGGLMISAVTGEGLEVLLEELDRTMVTFGIFEPADRM